ncbi:ABC transporter permease [Apibacter sp. HY039]|uniref:ABC transporter permease n=1 Tax=Apibacter sp. HY039 TaxID=2501476 RepID=UPI000FEBD913|nr:ABC transporter permease [Apibacter sp. HY039]
MLIFEKETWSEIYYSLSKNKLRTILTMIGVAWGMFLYVFLLGAAKGVENGFNRIFEGFATNSMFIWAANTGEAYKGYPKGREMSIRLKDVQALKQEIPEIDFIAPRNVSGMFGTEPSSVSRGNITKVYTVYGDYPIVSKVEKKDLIKGRFINQDDINQKRKVAVIGKEVAEQLFKNNEDPIGKNIKISGIYFQVIGVYKISAATMSNESTIYISFDTFQSLYNQGDKIGWMIISIKPQYNVKDVEKKVKSILKERNNVSPTDELAFGGFNFAEEYGKLTGFLSGMQILTWIVGGLTILAGVIAISNILLITVKERTLEIGIRRALGAKPREIKEQILIESVFLTVFSGVIGFIGGVLCLMLVTTLVDDPKAFPFYNPTVNLWNVFAALCLMVTLGLIIGLIPAQKAVQVKPIEALRSE